MVEQQRKKQNVVDPETYKFHIFTKDSNLKGFMEHFEYRNKRFIECLETILNHEESLLSFARSYKHYGFNVHDNGISFKEWLPGAKEVTLIGDFNGWNRESHRMQRDQYGNYSIFLPKKQNGQYEIPHNSKVKIHILNAQNQWVDKVPAWSKYSVQDGDKAFDACFWNPPNKYQWKNKQPDRPWDLKIYESHIGMAGIDPRVHTYSEFRQNVLPRIKSNGYNCVQFMAIQEHSYYGSFGYHVTGFYAPSSRFGNPDELKELIDTAHGMGLYVIMDLVHSHASSNAQDGINMQDGTSYQYFHEGDRGDHKQWDSKCFDYGKYEVQRFLLSNLAWYLDEFKFDGFRFDGVTSMLYSHHGLGVGFTGNYQEYFTFATDIDALMYLMLANLVVHEINPNAITIAEDVSGMPTIGSSIKEGGIGFDYRLAMSIPDKWIQFLKEYSDDQWDLQNLVFTLLNRRFDEKVIAYAESHDQAIVGDKTLAMWLFDKEMYFCMSLTQPENIIINRGMALHKMIRLITIALGGDAYLNFMGNEFGHPEWIDFPRQGNNWSYHHCRRRWDLVEDKLLRYQFLNNFDSAMLNLESENKWLHSKDNYVSLQDNGQKTIAFERNGLLFIFNFHPTQSYENYKIGTNFTSDHIIIMDSDEARFGGQERLRHGHDHPFPLFKEPWNNRNNHIIVYIPSRTCMVLKPIKQQ